ncbi:MAG TPA: hypothetical protein VGC15_06460 [Acetobacteraceae bacterium]
MRAFLFAGLLLLPWAAQAQGQAAPSPGVKPRGTAQESSVAAPAPPAGIANTTGSTGQDAGVKAMNDAEKAKVESKGK